MKKWITYTYYLAALLLPLVFYTKTSELFEFNKMIFIYIITTVVTTLTAIDFILKNKVDLKKSFVTYPLIFFLGAMALSTIISIDFRTSLLGYYSRFHGGLISYISYALLFVIFRTYFEKETVKKFITVLIISTGLASFYAGLEHFGYSPSCLLVTGNLNVDCWVQDVQNRVFGTFGQPNWLAAWLVGIIPLSWYMATEEYTKNYKKYLYAFASIFFILVLYYTKSRSGFIALILSFLVFWGGTFYLERKDIKKHIPIFGIVTIFILIFTLLINTPWQPSVPVAEAQEYAAPALEVGGTESADIRKIVWTGAWDLFKKYPLLGTGLDTFAFSYYETRPMAHNLTSEWNFIYNRAHNEYLNFLSTTGLIGTIAYLSLLISFIYVILKDFNRLNSAIFASLITILVTNFFGFSTVAVGFLTFMLPAMSIANKNKLMEEKLEIDQNKKTLIGIVLFISAIILFFIAKYWVADTYYAEGKKYLAIGNAPEATQILRSAISLNGGEANYYAELAKATYIIGLIEESDKFADKALMLSPHNVSIHKQIANTYSNLAKLDPAFANKELRTIEKLLILAPTDPSVHYKYAAFLARTGNIEESIEKLKETIEMKPNYKIANILLAYLYEDTGEIELAKQQYEYILTYVDPNDEKIKQDLKEIDAQ